MTIEIRPETAPEVPARGGKAPGRPPAFEGPKPAQRPRRLRCSPQIRSLVRETRLDPSMLVAPLFVRPGNGIREPIASLPGQARLSVDETVREAERLAALGVGGVLLFGLPESKDEEGSGAWIEDGIVQTALRRLRSERPAARPHRRHVPLRVHEPRPLRTDRVRRGGAERRRPRRASRRPPSPRPRGRRHRRAERHDGRPGRGDPGGARPRRPDGDRDHGLRSEGRVRVLRPVPGGCRQRAGVRRPPRLPDGPGERARGDARDRARRRRRRRHPPRQAGHAAARPDRRGSGPFRSADRRVPGERRVRDARRGGGAGLDRPAARDAGSGHRDRAGRRRDRDHVRGRRHRRLAQGGSDDRGVVPVRLRPGARAGHRSPSGGGGRPAIARATSPASRPPRRQRPPTASRASPTRASGWSPASTSCSGAGRPRVDALERAAARTLRSGLGAWCVVRQSFIGRTAASQYVAKPTEQESGLLTGERSRYLIVYPFTKSTDWYLLSREARQGVMNEHMRVGHAYPVRPTGARLLVRPRRPGLPRRVRDRRPGRRSATSSAICAAPTRGARRSATRPILLGIRRIAGESDSASCSARDSDLVGSSRRSPEARTPGPAREDLFPGGVNSPVRAFRAVGRPQLVLERGAGRVRLGRRRSPIPRLHRLVGPGDPRARRPRRRGGGREAAGGGFALGATHPLEIELGEADPRPRCRRSSGCGSRRRGRRRR